MPCESEGALKINRTKAFPRPQQQTVTTIGDGQVQAPTGTPTAGGNGGSATGTGRGGSATGSGGSTTWVTQTVTVTTQCSTSGVSIICSSSTLSRSATRSTKTLSLPSLHTVTIPTPTLSILQTTISASNVSFVTTWATVVVTVTGVPFLNTTTMKLTNSTTQSVTTTTMPAVSQISDGQVQATASADPTSASITTTTMDPVSTIGDGQVQATKSAVAVQARDVAVTLDERSVGFFMDSETVDQMKPVGCRTNGTLEIQLHHGVLTDNLGRTGYIASNYQFQFDHPAQAGAIYTAGFSLCSNGSLALGGSTTFYRCLSGNFYNLYDRYWAAQCEAIQLVMLNLQDCSSK